MNDAVVMSRGQPFRELHPEAEDFFLRQRPGSYFLAERDSGDVFHHQEIHTLLCVEVVDGGDVGMIKLRENQSLFVKMRAGRFVDQRTGRKDLDGNIAAGRGRDRFLPCRRRLSSQRCGSGSTRCRQANSGLTLGWPWVRSSRPLTPTTILDRWHKGIDKKLPGAGKTNPTWGRRNCC